MANANGKRHDTNFAVKESVLTIRVQSNEMKTMIATQKSCLLNSPRHGHTKGQNPKPNETFQDRYERVIATFRWELYGEHDYEELATG